jgi:NTP pyrophosphatase (non-canonical NTP hydrolase)
VSNRDYLEALFEIVDPLNNKYPTGNTLFQIVARLAEEVGELAQAVNHCERAGIKEEKYGPPDRAKLAAEVHHVLRAALGVARYYGIEGELKESTRVTAGIRAMDTCKNELSAGAVMDRCDRLAS